LPDIYQARSRGTASGKHLPEFNELSGAPEDWLKLCPFPLEKILAGFAPTVKILVRWWIGIAAEIKVISFSAEISIKGRKWGAELWKGILYSGRADGATIPGRWRRNILFLFLWLRR